MECLWIKLSGLPRVLYPLKDYFKKHIFLVQLKCLFRQRSNTRLDRSNTIGEKAGISHFDILMSRAMFTKFEFHFGQSGETDFK